jgi:DNA-directed RNA polymerase specialized sigma24 family protein
MSCARTTPNNILARLRIQHWAAERTALNSGKVRQYTSPGRPAANPSTARYDAALVRVIDFEREFGKLPTESQMLLLLAYREHQPIQMIAQVMRCSVRAVEYKLPAALKQLAAILARADLL